MGGERHGREKCFAQEHKHNVPSPGSNPEDSIHRQVHMISHHVTTSTFSTYPSDTYTKLGEGYHLSQKKIFLNK